MIRPIIQQPSYPTRRPKAGDNKQRQREDNTAFTPPPLLADENYLPAPESLNTLIRSAISSLKRGVVWERGSIINLNL